MRATVLTQIAYAVRPMFVGTFRTAYVTSGFVCSSCPRCVRASHFTYVTLAVCPRAVRTGCAAYRALTCSSIPIVRYCKSVLATYITDSVVVSIDMLAVGAFCRLTRYNKRARKNEHKYTSNQCNQSCGLFHCFFSPSLFSFLILNPNIVGYNRNFCCVLPFYASGKMSKRLINSVSMYIKYNSICANTFLLVAFVEAVRFRRGLLSVAK